jgi:hypothetical protein
MLLSYARDLGAGNGGMPFMTVPPGRPAGFPTLPDYSVFIPVRAWAAQMSRGGCDVTASCHYEPNTDLIYPTVIPTSLSMEIRAEGVLHLDVIPQTLILGLFSGSEPAHVILGFDYYNPFFEGDC